MACYLFWGARRHDSAAAFSAFGAKVDNPIGVANYIKVVLDDHNGVAQVGQPMQHIEQLFDIVEMQARGGLVQQVKSLTGLTFAQFAGQFNALGLAAGKRDCGLSKMNVAQANVDE